MDYKRYLHESVLMFWIKNAIDEKNGGIFTCLDRQGDIYGRDKSVWFQGRALWTLSRAYNTFEKRREYLEAAKKIYDFLPKCIDNDGKMFFLVTDTGEPVQKRRYYFSETFAAIGCAEYFLASGDESAWTLAEACFDMAYKRYSDSSMDEPKFYRAEKALSPVMIMLATASAMASVCRNAEKYNRIAARLLDETLHGGYWQEEPLALLEHVSADGKFMDTPTGRVVNPGHSIETAWFIIDEGLRVGNDEAICLSKKIIEGAISRGMAENGGLVSFCDLLGRPPVEHKWDMKFWWPQCETIIACKSAYEVFGEQIYLERYHEMLDYVFKYFADGNLEWFGYLHYDNTVATTLKGDVFKGPFHVPRMLMRILENPLK